MGKYTPLGQFLATADKENIDISFAEIESLLGFPLPTSAYTHRPWWANGGHSQASAWLNAGYKVAQVDLGMQKVHFRRGECNTNQSHRLKASHPKAKPSSHPTHTPSVSDVKTLNILGFDFRLIQQLLPQCDDDGRITKFYPQNAYDNKNNLPLLYYGSGAFCRFSIQAGDWQGVYLWIVNGEIIYIGETENLRSRFNTGYGHIAPRNCYVGGQSTNCKMNKVVMNLFEQGQKIDLYFYDTPNYKQVELVLLRKIKTQYNKKDNG